MLILQCSHLQWYTDMMQATMCEKDLEFLGWFHLQRTIEWFRWIRTLSKATLFTFHFVLLHLAIIDYQQYQAVVSQKAFRTHPILSLDTYALLHHWRLSRYMNCMLFKVTASDIAKTHQGWALSSTTTAYDIAYKINIQRNTISSCNYATSPRFLENEINLSNHVSFFKCIIDLKHVITYVKESNITLHCPGYLLPWLLICNYMSAATITASLQETCGVYHGGQGCYTRQCWYCLLWLRLMTAWRRIIHLLLPMLDFFILFTREAANDNVKILIVPPYKKIVTL